MILNGIRYVVSEPVPRMQLSKDCPVTPEFRAEMNQWMREFFGVENSIDDGQVFHHRDSATGITTAYMNQNTYNQMIQQFRKV